MFAIIIIHMKTTGTGRAVASLHGMSGEFKSVRRRGHVTVRQRSIEKPEHNRGEFLSLSPWFSMSEQGTKISKTVQPGVDVSLSVMDWGF